MEVVYIIDPTLILLPPLLFGLTIVSLVKLNMIKIGFIKMIKFKIFNLNHDNYIQDIMRNIYS